MKNIRISKNSNIILLAIYDLIIALFMCYFVLYVYQYDLGKFISFNEVFTYGLLFTLLVFIFRIVFKVYKQIWRYGNATSYLRLIISDVSAMFVFYIISEYRLCKAFGHGGGWTVGLIFLNFIFIMMLGFGKSKYQGNVYLKEM